jgi:hypothetical protein
MLFIIAICWRCGVSTIEPLISLAEAFPNGAEDPATQLLRASLKYHSYLVSCTALPCPCLCPSAFSNYCCCLTHTMACEWACDLDGGKIAMKISVMKDLQYYMHRSHDVIDDNRILLHLNDIIYVLMLLMNILLCYAHGVIKATRGNHHIAPNTNTNNNNICSACI